MRRGVDRGDKLSANNLNTCQVVAPERPTALDSSRASRFFTRARARERDLLRPLASRRGPRAAGRSRSLPAREVVVPGRFDPREDVSSHLSPGGRGAAARPRDRSRLAYILVVVVVVVRGGRFLWKVRGSPFGAPSSGARPRVSAVVTPCALAGRASPWTPPPWTPPRAPPARPRTSPPRANLDSPSPTSPRRRWTSVAPTRTFATTSPTRPRRSAASARTGTPRTSSPPLVRTRGTCAWRARSASPSVPTRAPCSTSSTSSSVASTSPASSPGNSTPSSASP